MAGINIPKGVLMSSAVKWRDLKKILGCIDSQLCDLANKPFPTPSFTAVEASALTPADGDLIYVTDTDATFTQVGFWGYVSGTWTALH